MKKAQVIVNLRQFLSNENYWARYAIIQELQIYRFSRTRKGVYLRSLLWGPRNIASVLLTWDPGSF